MNALFHKLVITLGLLIVGLGSFSSSANAAVLRHETASSSREVTLAEVHRLFREMAGQRQIAFRFVEDGCYARAHLMMRHMQDRGFHPVRVWSFSNGESLHVKTSLMSRGYVEWRYHVAPAIPIQANGRTVYLVIDPSLFNRPVTLDEWVKVQRKGPTSPKPIVEITRLGEPVHDPHNRNRLGSGYWPGVDPIEGIDTHALETMRRYKAKESMSR